MKNKYIIGSLIVAGSFLNSSKKNIKESNQKRHKPVIADEDNLTKNNPYLIDKPEISLALYGSLNGKKNYYKIESDEDFNLYIGILTPRLDEEKEPKNKVYFKFYDENFKEITFNDFPTGVVKDHIWTEWFEPFGRNNYWVGPQVGTNLNVPYGKYPKGTYYIEVFNPKNEGNYSLAVGYIEDFGFFDILKLIFGSTLKKVNQFWK